jgi:hypothetical protein
MEIGSKRAGTHKRWDDVAALGRASAEKELLAEPKPAQIYRWVPAPWLI